MKLITITHYQVYATLMTSSRSRDQRSRSPTYSKSTVCSCL